MKKIQIGDLITFSWQHHHADGVDTIYLFGTVTGTITSDTLHVEDVFTQGCTRYADELDVKVGSVLHSQKPHVITRG
jgi:endonuclease YncB( thermonuclease family)